MDEFDTRILEILVEAGRHLRASMIQKRLERKYNIEVSVQLLTYHLSHMPVHTTQTRVRKYGITTTLLCKDVLHN